MIKADKTVRYETLYIAASELVFSIPMQLVFFVIGRWNYTVLAGNLLGGITAVLNFYLMGLTIQKAVQKEQKQAALHMRISQSCRMLMILVIAIVGFLTEYFNIWALLIPLIFPRIAIAFRPFFNKYIPTDGVKKNSDNN